MQEQLKVNSSFLIPAYLLLCGVFAAFMGFAWDIQWHSDVGPDSFWTAPHILIYFGAGLAGLTCLYVAIRTTILFNHSKQGFNEHNTSRFLLGFRGPKGYIISGVGSVIFLAYGGYDEYWHTLFGFDVTIASPPHIGLLLGCVITSIGAVFVFAAEANKVVISSWSSLLQSRVIGLSLSMAVLLSNALYIGIPFIGAVVYGPMNAYSLIMGIILSLGFLAAASVIRRPGIFTMTAAAYTAIRLLAWYCIPWLTQIQADIEGILFREVVSGFPSVALYMPAYLIGAGIILDLLMLWFRQTNKSILVFVIISGAILVLYNHLTYQVFELMLPSPQLTDKDREFLNTSLDHSFVPTLFMIPVVGGLFGWIGWRLGTILRHIYPNEIPFAEQISKEQTGGTVKC